MLTLCVGLILCGCNGNSRADKLSETRLLLGTYCTVTIYNADAPEIINEVFEMCLQYEEMFSVNIENSDVWHINHAQGEPVTVSAQTIELIKEGMKFGEISDGLFDITIGSLSSLWDFSGGNNTVPEIDMLEQACHTVDYRQIDISGNTVQLKDPDTRLDLGGIAKGYIADKIAQYLIAGNIEHAVIDLGGDIVTLGSRPGGDPWRIGIKKPFGGSGELAGVIEAADAAVISSGIYERQFEIDGMLYHHILDPYSGMPSQSDVISATVIAGNAVTGEGLATIAVLVGSENVQELFMQTSGFIGAVLILENNEILTIGEAQLIR